MPLSNLNTTDWSPQPLEDRAIDRGVPVPPLNSYEEARDFYLKINENATLPLPPGLFHLYLIHWIKYSGFAQLTTKR